MFSRLDNSDFESFKGSIVKQLRAFTTELEQKGISRSDENYLSLIDKRSSIAVSDDIEELKEILESCEHFIGAEKDQVAAIRNCMKQLAAITTDTTYESILGKINKPVGTAFFDAKKEEKHDLSTIKGRIKQQIQTIDKTDIDKGEMIKVILGFNTNEKFCGFYLDYNKISSDITFEKPPGTEQEDYYNQLLTLRNKTFFDEIGKILTACEAKSIDKVQFIIKKESHYIPFNIEIKNKSCFLFDAAGDLRKVLIFQIVDFLKDKIDILIDANTPGITHKEKQLTNGNLQKREFGCAIYALELCLVLSKFKHTDLLKRAKVGDKKEFFDLRWEKLSPQVMALSESIQIIEHYITKLPASHREKLKSQLDLLTKNNTKYHGITQATLKFQNMIEQITNQYSDSAIEEIAKKASSSGIETLGKKLTF